MPDQETLKWIMDSFGWPGLTYITFVAGVIKAWNWYVNVKYPADREDRMKKIDADHEYRLRHTAKMDGLTVQVIENTRQTERNTGTVKELKDSFIRAGIYKTKEL